MALALASSLTACGQQPSISVYPPSLSFVAEEGKGNPPSQTVNISNSGGGILEWSLNSSTDWLTLEPSSGISTDAIDTVSVSINMSAMKPGNYSTVIIISDPRATVSPLTIPVTFEIKEPMSTANEGVATFTQYTSDKFGYSLYYPSTWYKSGTDEELSIMITGEKLTSENMQSVFVMVFSSAQNVSGVAFGDALGKKYSEDVDLTVISSHPGSGEWDWVIETSQIHSVIGKRIYSDVHVKSATGFLYVVELRHSSQEIPAEAQAIVDSFRIESP